MTKEETRNQLTPGPTQEQNHIDDQYQKQVKQPQEDKLQQKKGLIKNEEDQQQQQKGSINQRGLAETPKRIERDKNCNNQPERRFEVD